MRWRSVRHTPQARTSIRTCPAPGSGRGSVRATSGRRGPSTAHRLHRLAHCAGAGRLGRDEIPTPGDRAGVDAHQCITRRHRGATAVVRSIARVRRSRRCLAWHCRDRGPACRGRPRAAWPNDSRSAASRRAGLVICPDFAAGIQEATRSNRVPPNGKSDSSSPERRRAARPRSQHSCSSIPRSRCRPQRSRISSTPKSTSPRRTIDYARYHAMYVPRPVDSAGAGDRTPIYMYWRPRAGTDRPLQPGDEVDRAAA